MLEGTKGKVLWLERVREPRELTPTVLLPSRVADAHAAAGLPLPGRPGVAEGTLKTRAQPQVAGVLRVPPGPSMGEPRSDRRSPASPASSLFRGSSSDPLHATHYFKLLTATPLRLQNMAVCSSLLNMPSKWRSLAMSSSSTSSSAHW